MQHRNKTNAITLLFYLLLQFSGSAQQVTGKTVPLRSLVEEALNNFESFKGDPKEPGSEDIFTSNVTLEGTNDNMISVRSESLVQYYAYVRDSATKKEAKAVVEQWQKKISLSLPDYRKEKMRSKIQRRLSEGYRFVKTADKQFYTVSILWSKREVDQFYWVLLTVSRQNLVLEEASAE
ncbi:MAG: hypothetical protein EON98_03950 [Chitinophagaceae bacterium]|nr:MAG: hypothetical protein EON98_03950 [Chitinophagaceae bacterium]